MIRKLIAVFVVCASLGAQSPDPWRGLRFLIGAWDAKTQGGSAGASATGAYQFQLELKDHVLARHSSAAGCKGPADFNCEHGDLLYVYAEGPSQALKAIYFDNEGHAIHYDVETPQENTAVFLSAAGPGPQFRLIYELKGRTMSGKFQMRMPGAKDFTSYLEWGGDKK
jgi:hypothetical protein